MFTMNRDNIRTVTDMRTNTIDLLAQVKKHGYKYIFKGSKPQAVLMDIKKYHKLMEDWEDLQDAELAAKLVKEPKGAGKSFEEVAREYGVAL